MERTTVVRPEGPVEVADPLSQSRRLQDGTRLAYAGMIEDKTRDPHYVRSRLGRVEDDLLDL